jgi:hypothetical protein
MGEIGILFVSLCESWIGPTSTSFFWCEKLIPPTAKPIIPSAMRRIPTIVAGFIVASPH